MDMARVLLFHHYYLTLKSILVGINRNNIASILLIVLLIFVLHFVDGDFLSWCKLFI